MDVNFFGALNMTSVALPALLERRGQIVVMSSVAGFAPLVLRSGYAASKHALHGCFESLRAELRGNGVGVTMVCPSFVRTVGAEHALGAHGDVPTHRRTETGMPADPADLADAVFDATVRRRRLLLHSRTAKLSYLVSRVWAVALQAHDGAPDPAWIGDDQVGDADDPPPQRRRETEEGVQLSVGQALRAGPGAYDCGLELANELRERLAGVEPVLHLDEGAFLGHFGLGDEGDPDPIALIEAAAGHEAVDPRWRSNVRASAHSTTWNTVGCRSG
jgi:hypothetical protein